MTYHTFVIEHWVDSAIRSRAVLAVCSAPSHKRAEEMARKVFPWALDIEAIRISPGKIKMLSDQW
jgi:hypothetical protein